MGWLSWMDRQVVTTSHGFYQSFNAGASWAVVSVAGTVSHQLHDRQQRGREKEGQCSGGAER